MTQPKREDRVILMGDAQWESPQDDATPILEQLVADMQAAGITAEALEQFMSSRAEECDQAADYMTVCRWVQALKIMDLSDRVIGGALRGDQASILACQSRATNWAYDYREAGQTAASNRLQNLIEWIPTAYTHSATITYLRYNMQDVGLDLDPRQNAATGLRAIGVDEMASLGDPTESTDRLGGYSINQETLRELWGQMERSEIQRPLGVQMHVSSDYDLFVRHANRERSHIRVWLWEQLCQRLNWDPTMQLIPSELMQGIANREAQALMGVFGLHCDIGFAGSTSLADMHFQFTPSSAEPSDLQGRRIVGRLFDNIETTHRVFRPQELGSLFFVFNPNGHYEFANYGQRPPTEAPAQGSSSTAACPPDLRGRDSGCDGNSPQRNQPRRARRIHLDL